MEYDSNFRQIAMWIDLNNPLHYQTLFAVQQLVDKLNSDPSNTQVTVSFRPYFNMFRANHPGETSENSSRNLVCSPTIKDYCLDSKIYGSVE